MGESLIEGIGNEVLIYCGAFLTMVAGAFTVSRYLPYYNEARQEPTAQASGRTYNSEICPICIGPHRLAVETNCGHKFCGQCIQHYLNNRGAGELTLFTGRGLTCPMCRQNINLLLLGFSRDESSDPAERREIETAVYEYNIRFGNGPRSIMTYIRDCPVLLRHMLLEFFSVDGLVCLFRLRIICCLAVAIIYFVIPLDVLPEALFGLFGFLDDLFIVCAFVLYLSIMYRRFLLNRANEAEM